MSKKSYDTSYESVFGNKNKAAKVNKKKAKSSKKKDSVIADLLNGSGSKKKKKKKKKSLEKELLKAIGGKLVIKDDDDKYFQDVPVFDMDPEYIYKLFNEGGAGIYHIYGKYHGADVLIMVACPMEFSEFVNCADSPIGYNMNSGYPVMISDIQQIDKVRISRVIGLKGVEQYDTFEELFADIVISIHATADDADAVAEEESEGEGDKNETVQ